MESSAEKTGEVQTDTLTPDTGKANPGASWKKDETQVLPKNRLTIVCSVRFKEMSFL
jgi:hypothetical protein